MEGVVHRYHLFCKLSSSFSSYITTTWRYKIVPHFIHIFWSFIDVWGNSCAVLESHLDFIIFLKRSSHPVSQMKSLLTQKTKCLTARNTDKKKHRTQNTEVRQKTKKENKESKKEFSVDHFFLNFKTTKLNITKQSIRAVCDRIQSKQLGLKIFWVSLWRILKEQKICFVSKLSVGRVFHQYIAFLKEKNHVAACGNGLKFLECARKFDMHAVNEHVWVWCFPLRNSLQSGC